MHSEFNVIENAGSTPPAPDSAGDLVIRLTAIRERLFMLAACYATSLSHDIAYEADRWREIFRDLADKLRSQDAEALDRITAGHEALLFADASPKPTIPLATQEMVELVSEVRSQRSQPHPPKPQSCALQNWP